MISALRPAVKIALFQQSMMLMVSVLLLDGGVFLTISSIAFMAFWVGVGLIFYRRGTNPTKRDVLLIRMGSIPLSVLALIYSLWFTS